MRKLNRFIQIAFGSLVVSVLSLPVQADMVEYTSGHADIGLALEPTGLHIHYHFGSGAVVNGATITAVDGVEYSADEAYVRVGDNARQNAPSSLSQLGVQANNPVWILPLADVSGFPRLGLAAEELAAPLASPKFQLTNFNYIGSGSGNFALWLPDSFGGLDFKMVSNDGFGANDVFNSTIGGHEHFFWGFSSEGVYELTITGSALDENSNLLSDTGKFTFVVGSATAVPEPGTIGLLATSSIAGAWYARRKRRAKSAAAC